MKHITILSIFILLSIDTFTQNTPTYTQFATTLEKKRAREVNWSSHPKASEFETNLKSALERKSINFAGKFILTQWGCGTACIQAALIDTQTGEVYFPEILQGVTQGYIEAFANHEILEFKNSSNLLIIYGKAGSDFKEASKDYVQGISYFEWTGKDFSLIKFITK
jgi:hypothetical protein